MQKSTETSEEDKVERRWSTFIDKKISGWKANTGQSRHLFLILY